MLMSVVFMVGGLAVLVGGGELLIRGSVRLSRLAGISPLVIGLTVVAFGTSAPELAVAVKAGLAGQSEIAVGNIVGSNICNVLLILGISALITPLVTSSQLVRRDVPLMIVVSLLALAFAWDGRVGGIDGSLLFAGLVIYTGWSIRASRRETASVQKEFEQEFGSAAAQVRGSWPVQVLLIGLGLGLLVVGADWLVRGASDLARWWGMSELLIGLTIVAVGTSLPEVAASVTASLHGERDIAVGNVVGSNLFNLMCVLGLSSMVTPGGMAVPDTALRVDMPVMIVVAVACLPIFFTGHKIARWEGALFLAYYVAYMAYLILAATDPGVSRTVATMVVGFALPLTAITLGVCVVRAMQRGNPSELEAQRGD